MDATIRLPGTIARPGARASTTPATCHARRSRHLAAAIALAAAVLAAVVGGLIGGVPGGPPAGPAPIPLPGLDIVVIIAR